MIRELVGGDEIMSLEDAKRWLRVDDDGSDVDIERAIAQARAYCERQSAQVFRTMVRFEEVLPCWPDERGQVPTVEDRPLVRPVRLQRSRYYLPHPPHVHESGVDVGYMLSGVETKATGYRVIPSTTSQSYVEWDEHSVLPTTDVRDDAVRIRWWSGPTSVCPGKVLCMQHVLRAVWDGELEEKTWTFFDGFLQRFSYGHYA